MAASPECDVVVLGGGPAGTAAAMSLAAAGRSVVVLEHSRYQQARLGETLSPAARVPLARLGVWERFVGAGHEPSPGIVSFWGEDAPVERQFIFNPYGQGWHLDRQRFDAMLAEAADRAGARVSCGVRLTACAPDASSGWRVEFGDGRRRHELRAAFVLDATGRPASFARRQGANRIASDRLVGVAVVLTARSPGDTADPRTLVEAIDEGWWYSALLPGARLVAVYMTDADLLPRGRRAWPAFWRSRLQRTACTKEVVRSFDWPPDESSGARVVAAGGASLDRMTGRGWLAAGDAALAFDPLSSQGMLRALTSGIDAGAAVDRCLAGDTAALDRYEDGARETLREYARLHALVYGRERRWPDSLFWRRRQGAAAH